MSDKRKLFVIGIGGTGSRVIKSLSLLLASGCTLKGGFTNIIPIIIDPDNSNGDLMRTMEILNLYQKIRINIDGVDKGEFFNQKIQSLKSNNQYDNIDFRFFLKGVDTNTFENYIGFRNLNEDYTKSTDDKNFIRLLYSKKNLKSELKVGFKGHPNMGTVVLDQITQSETFKYFVDKCDKDDAIFLINSIFGGTGAAGLPLLLKSIKSQEKLKNTKIGAITYLPYFEIGKKDPEIEAADPEEIKSNSFLEKTKVAIAYYNRTIIENKELDSIYFIGHETNSINHEYEHHIGANLQKNDANFLELAGSLAIFDFCESPKKTENKPLVKEYGLDKSFDGEIEFDHLSKRDRDVIERNLACFKVFSDYLLEEKGLKRALGVSRWTLDRISSIGGPKYKNSTLTDSYFEGAEYTSSVETFIHHFRDWLDEMRKNYPAFAPFPKTCNSKDALRVLPGKPFKGFRSIDRENNRLISSRKIWPHDTTKVHSALFRLFEHSIRKFVTK